MLNLLTEILERIEYERLIEEGKDPREVLHYKYQQVPSDIIDSVIEIDPTKKKSYSQWLLSKWNDEKNTIVDNLENGRIAKLFQFFKDNNGFQIKDYGSVGAPLQEFVPEVEGAKDKMHNILTKSSAPTTILHNNGWTKQVPSELANDFDIVFNDDNWIIAVPHTYEADCKLGENMYWCTAGGRTSYETGRGYYNRYLSDYGGKYYVNFDMSQGESRLGVDYPFTRYQFHFESNQFMDKDDEPVELSEIDMPDSAKEFYSDEGYSTDQFENLEARMERYEEQRWGWGYRLNDELLLNFAYDEDFHFEEPNENTDFYLFSVDDDRDPISWDEVENPHSHDDVVILNTDTLILLKKKYGKSDNGVIAVIKRNNRWNDWETSTFNQYIVLKDNWGVFGIDTNDHFSVETLELTASYDRIKVNSCENMFINEQCTNAYNAENEENIFVEAVCNGYHTLFNLSISSTVGNDMICVVHKDVPVNGEYFTINEKGLIEGEFRSYRVYNDDEYDEEDGNLQYDLEDKLPSGDYLISTTAPDGYGGRSKIEYNILKKGSNQPLLETWFDNFMGGSANLYGVKKENKVGFFSIANGQQVGRWYDSYSGLDKDNDIIVGYIGNSRLGIQEQADIINGNQGSVTATFTNVLTRKSPNNKIIVLCNDENESTRVFDYMGNKFCFPELNNFSRVNQYAHPYLFVCNIGGTEEKAIFDLASEKILVRGIEDISSFNRYESKYFRLNKMNGKCNAFDVEKQTEMLQNDVDDITGFNANSHILVYCVNGKYYPLNYQSGNIMINPNGIGVPTIVDTYGRVLCFGENYQMLFMPNDGQNNYEFRRWENRSSYSESGTNFDPQTTPQEVLNMYNLIFGQQESITRNFKNYVKRINEAMKHRYNDLID